MEERKSVFIGHAKPVTSEEEARAFIDSIRHQYADATHNVYAYLLNGGAVARYSDDGEPHGTSGVPTLNVLKMSGAMDLVVVVT
ncbi:MAG: YigZ family protein, partial [Clostridia bacterium]|nr:YigZ family protein [Clostridia bacterium]